jgi:hypothetical protein
MLVEIADVLELGLSLPRESAGYEKTILDRKIGA